MTHEVEYRKSEMKDTVHHLVDAGFVNTFWHVLVWSGSVWYFRYGVYLWSLICFVCCLWCFVWGMVFEVCHLRYGVWGMLCVAFCLRYVIWGMVFEVCYVWCFVWGMVFEVCHLRYGVWGMVFEVWCLRYGVWGMVFVVCAVLFVARWEGCTRRGGLTGGLSAWLWLMLNSVSTVTGRGKESRLCLTQTAGVWVVRMCWLLLW